jgi:four helix bundle protein
MANIAEGFERSTSSEFHQALSIAKGSAAEVRSHLYAAYDVGYLSEQEFEQLQTQVREVSRLVAALRRSVRMQIESQKPVRRY